LKEKRLSRQRLGGTERVNDRKCNRDGDNGRGEWKQTQEDGLTEKMGQ